MAWQMQWLAEAEVERFSNGKLGINKTSTTFSFSRLDTACLYYNAHSRNMTAISGSTNLYNSCTVGKMLT